MIFDCDGVLVDSERLTNTVFAEMLNCLGIALTLDDMFDRFVGNSMATCLGMVEQLLGGPVPADFVDDYRARCRATLERDLQPVRGIHEALAQIPLPMCVASSGDFDKMRMTLGITNLLPHFEGRLYSVVEVAHGKPEPDVFLHAAKSMGCTPQRSVVIEDTPIGVRAGVAAGMTVFGYAEMMNAARLQEAGAHLTFDDMAQLPRLITGQS